MMYLKKNIIMKNHACAFKHVQLFSTKNDKNVVIWVNIIVLYRSSENFDFCS